MQVSWGQMRVREQGSLTEVAATIVEQAVGATAGVQAGRAGVCGGGGRGAVRHRPHLLACPYPGRLRLTWGRGQGPWGVGSRGCSSLRGLRLHLPRLRLPQGPGQGLCLLLEGAVAFPREPELKLNARVGLLQEDLGGGGDVAR